MDTKVYDISIRGNLVKTEGYKLFEQQVKTFDTEEEAKAYASDFTRQKELEGYKRFAGKERGTTETVDTLSPLSQVPNLSSENHSIKKLKEPSDNKRETRKMKKGEKKDNSNLTKLLLPKNKIHHNSKKSKTKKEKKSSRGNSKKRDLDLEKTLF